METVRAAEKYFWPSPLVIQRLATIAASDTAPDTSPMTTGTPVRGEIRPSARGPAPSMQAAAWARPAPMIQAEPLASRTQMNTRALAQPSSWPAPDRATDPSTATDPPYTVKTVFMASIRPPSDVTCSAGSTTRTARMGMPYISACPIPALAMATGMSRRGLRISSPAVEGSSTPTKE
jgi:hypothetical protein